MLVRGSVGLFQSTQITYTWASPEYLNNAWDVSTMRYIFKRGREFIEYAPGLEDFILGRYGGQIGVDTDDEIDEFIRQTV